MSYLEVSEENNKKNNTPIDGNSPRNSTPNPLLVEKITIALNNIKSIQDNPDQMITGFDKIN